MGWGCAGRGLSWHRCRRGATCAGLAAGAGGACVEELLPWGRGRASAGRSWSDGREQGVGGRTKLCGEGERRGGAWEDGGDGGTGWDGGGRTGHGGTWVGSSVRPVTDPSRLPAEAERWMDQSPTAAPRPARRGWGAAGGDAGGWGHRQAAEPGAAPRAPGLPQRLVSAVSNAELQLAKEISGDTSE